MSLKSPIFAGVNGSANGTTGEITYIMSPVVMHTAHVLKGRSFQTHNIPIREDLLVDEDDAIQWSRVSIAVM